MDPLHSKPINKLSAIGVSRQEPSPQDVVQNYRDAAAKVVANDDLWTSCCFCGTDLLKTDRKSHQRRCLKRPQKTSSIQSSESALKPSPSAKTSILQADSVFQSVSSQRPFKVAENAPPRAISEIRQPTALGLCPWCGKKTQATAPHQKGRCLIRAPRRPKLF